jgi:hypothetical protein
MRTFVPSGSVDPPSAAWGIRRAVRLAFPEPAALAGDPVHAERLERYLADLLHPYGLAPDASEHGGQSYGEMAEALIHAAVPAGESVDLLVLAYSVPDITPGRATATYLSHVCPGTPMAFAVSDQGTASAFTALRLVEAYARSGGLRRALLLVVEQNSLPYDPGVPVTVPTANHGVALLFGEPLPGERVARVSTHALPTDFPLAALTVELGLLGIDSEPVTAILDAALAVRSVPLGPRSADAGQPGTGLWWELAGELAGPPGGPRRLLLADYDAGLRQLSLATVHR